MRRLIVETCSDPSMKTFHRHLPLWFTCTSLCAALKHNNVLMENRQLLTLTDRISQLRHTHTHTHILQNRSSFQSSKWPSRSINKMSVSWNQCVCWTVNRCLCLRINEDTNGIYICSDLVLEHVQPHFHLKPSFSFSIMFYMNMWLRDPGMVRRITPFKSLSFSHSRNIWTELAIGTINFDFYSARLSSHKLP